MSSSLKEELKATLNFTVFVGALGYFVDMYDLLLYGIVRIPSLTALGITGDKLVTVGVFLLNMQMAGMLIGGIIWGVLGDKRGRKSVLFGSIAIYSLANIANAFVTTTGMYAAVRFCAGVGLAGELGAAITLVSEVLKKESRGYGTTIVACVGLLGSVTAGLAGTYLTWRAAYIFGGGLGLLLLAMQAKLFESGIYSSIISKGIKRGSFISLFNNRERFFKYMRCIMIGLPMWFVVGILIMLSPELGKHIGVIGIVMASKAIMYTYMGLIAGDIVSGFCSQYFKTRKKVVATFLTTTSIFVILYFSVHNISLTFFYTLCFFIGASIGYWAVFVTIASEQFGTNMRATVTTTVPNFVRGSTVLITLSFQALRGWLGLTGAALTVGFTTIILAFISLYFMEETYHKDLNYIEEIE
ncbi:MAG: MFS transporter [Bacteroidia bacterium]|nr:MFS transporter [Bacteroidia bacterium]